MTVKRIVPNLASANPTGTADFYAEVLGLTLVMDMGWIVTFASDAAPAAQLSLLRPEPTQPHPDYSVEVTDLDDCHQRAVAAGHPIVYPLTTESWGVRRFFVRDLNGKIANVMAHT
jgi:catechol 2,3-dioxygenase-like lactoylglutathione lyase family enzyme